MCTSKSSLSHECTIHLNAEMYTSLKMIYVSLQPVESDSYDRTLSRSGIRKCLGEMFTKRRHQLKYRCGSSEHLWANIRCLLKVAAGAGGIVSKDNHGWHHHFTSCLPLLESQEQICPVEREFFHWNVREITTVQRLSSFTTKSAIAMVKLDMFFLAWPS